MAIGEFAEIANEGSPMGEGGGQTKGGEETAFFVDVNRESRQVSARRVYVA